MAREPEALRMASVGSGRQATTIVRRREQLQLLALGQVRRRDTQQAHPDAAHLGSGQREADAPDLLGLVGRARQAALAACASRRPSRAPSPRWSRP